MMMVLTMCYFTSVILEAFLLCRPVAYNWDKSIHRTCGFEGLAFLLQGIMNLIIDFGVIIVPMPMLWRLQMPFPNKLGLAAMFSIGVLYVLSVNTFAQHLDKLSIKSLLTVEPCLQYLCDYYLTRGVPPYPGSSGLHI